MAGGKENEKALDSGVFGAAAGVHLHVRAGGNADDLWRHIPQCGDAGVCGNWL